MWLDKLEEILHRLRSLQGDDINDIRKRCDLLDEAGQTIHRLRFTAALELVLKKKELGGSLDDQAEEKQVNSPRKGQYFKGLSRFKPLKNQTERERIAMEICDALFKIETDVKEHLRADGFETGEPLWPTWLIGLYNRYSDMKVQDFFDPGIPSRREFADLPSPYREEWLKRIDDGLFDSFAVAGYELLKQAEGERQKDRWEMNHQKKTLADELNGLEPPLTWGETIFHYMNYLTDWGERERLKELEQLFPAKRYCIVCGKPFEVSKYNPGYFRCSSCSTRLRVRQWRERKRQKSS